MIDHDFELEAEEVRPRYKTPPCPTCEGRGKLTRWRYHALCHRDRAGHITLFRHEKALQTLLENALKQSDYLFEEYNLDALPIDAPRCNGTIYFDSYTIPCPTCLGTGKINKGWE